MTWGAFIIIVGILLYMTWTERNNEHPSGAKWGIVTAAKHNVLFGCLIVPVMWLALWLVSLI
jgi:hypothetical protein